MLQLKKKFTEEQEHEAFMELERPYESCNSNPNSRIIFGQVLVTCYRKCDVLPVRTFVARHSSHVDKLARLDKALITLAQGVNCIKIYKRNYFFLKHLFFLFDIFYISS